MARAVVVLALLWAVVVAGPPPPVGAQVGRFPVGRNAAGDLVIGGTPHSEGILVEAFEDGRVTVTYDADATDPANPRQTATFTGPINGLLGDLGPGADRVEIRSLALTGDLSLDLGSGTDELLLVDTWTGGDLWLTAGSGDDQLWMFDVKIGRRSSASLGFGDDLVVFAGGAVADRTTITGSRGADRVSFSEVHLTGLLSVIGGRGDDELRLFLSTTDGVRFIGDEGDDAASIADTTVGAVSWFVGQAGVDSFTSSGTTTFDVPPRLIGIP